MLTLLLALLLVVIFGDLLSIILLSLSALICLFVAAFLLHWVIPGISLGVIFWGMVLLAVFHAVSGRSESQLNGYHSPRTPRSVRPEGLLRLKYSQRLFTPRDEQAFVDGCLAIIHGQDMEALLHLRKAIHLADGAFLAGLTALKLDHDEEAEEYLRSAAGKQCELTRHFSKYGLTASVKLSLIDELATEVEPDLRGVLLALIRTCTRQANWHEALAYSKELYRLEPHDPCVKLALADALMKASHEGRESYTQVIELTEDIENDSAVAAALLLERARALRRTRRHGEAREILVGLLFCKENRTTEFLDAVHHEENLLKERMDRF